MKKVYLFSVLASLLLASCSKEDIKVSKELNVLAGIGSFSTRALVTDASFTSGSAIAVFVTGTGYTSTATTYTLSGTTWTAVAPIYLTGNPASVYGYYPANAANSGGTLSAASTVTATLFAAPSSGISTEASFTGANQTDYMWATPKTVDSKSNDTVSMTYNHALTRIAFVIVKDANYPTAPGSGIITSIQLIAATAILPTAGTFKVSDGTFMATTGSNASTLQFTPAATTYINAAGTSTETACGLVAPTTTALTGIGLTMIIDGKTMTANGFPSSPTWLSGNSYTYTVTVSPTALIVSPTVTIAPWTVGTPVTGITAY